MLSELRANELGVIAEVTLVLGAGMTAITGETGAGKTLVVEAVELLVGGRADAGVVHAGAAEATVEGRFAAGPTDDDEEVVLRRIVAAAGRSRAHVDGHLATVGELASIGERLVDLHGQHLHQSLLAPAAQRAALDAFGGVDLEPLVAARAALAEVERAQHELGGDAKARAREVDLLRHQVAELDAAGLGDAEEDVRLSEEEDLLADATAHREAAAAAHHALSAEGGPSDVVGEAISSLAGRVPLAGVEARLRGLAAELVDVAVELRDLADALEDDPARLSAIRERRQLLVDLRRRYGDTLADVMAFHAEAEDRLRLLEQAEARAAGLDAEHATASAAVLREAASVRTAREVAACPLAEAVQTRLRELAMPGARLEVSVDGDDGSDVRFLLSANPGEPVAPLAKVASGGELARAMLALRLALHVGDARTLVFDEVDAGIGGEAALAVGRALADLARDHQVLVVTHLAQVAAFADAQVVVAKREIGGRTVSSATTVDGDERVRELARMIAGTPDAEAARAAAADLLAARRVSPGEAGPGGTTPQGRGLMAVARRTTDAAVAPPVVHGTARVDARTKRLVTRLDPGDVAIIDHADLDRPAAEALLASKVKAVVNASASTTGRYPNMGPLLLARAGVVVIDRAGPDLLSAVSEGAAASIDGPDVCVDGRVVATGVLQSVASLEAAHTAAKERLGEELHDFAENTLEYIKRERHVMLERPPPPNLGVDLQGRHVLVCVRGPSTDADLRELMPYVREMQPVLIGVDGGADALLRAGLKPDVIVGDFDSVTTDTMRVARKLVVHAYPGGTAPGAERLEAADLAHVVYESPGVSEDVAMLLAWELGAEMIVAVGTHVSMEEFLDKGRHGMASTFLTRLLLGSVLVDAKGVSRLYASRLRKRDLAMFFVVIIVLFAAMVLLLPQSRTFAELLWFLFTERIRRR